MVAGPVTTVLTTHVYDHRGRLVDTRKQIDAQPEYIQSRLFYNQVGQLRQKKLHGDLTGSNFIDSVHYEYNERGWTGRIGSSRFTQVQYLSFQWRRVFMANCLFCYQPVDSGEYHPTCSRRFFGTTTVPTLELDKEKLIKLGQITVNERLAITGVQPKLSLERVGKVIMQYATNSGLGMINYFRLVLIIKKGIWRL